jgi:hypothetical protein
MKITKKHIDDFYKNPIAKIEILIICFVFSLNIGGKLFDSGFEVSFKNLIRVLAILLMVACITQIIYESLRGRSVK